MAPNGNPIPISHPLERSVDNRTSDLGASQGISTALDLNGDVASASVPQETAEGACKVQNASPTLSSSNSANSPSVITALSPTEAAWSTTASAATSSKSSLTPPTSNPRSEEEEEAEKRNQAAEDILASAHASLVDRWNATKALYPSISRKARERILCASSLEATSDPLDVLAQVAITRERIATIEDTHAQTSNLDMLVHAAAVVEQGTSQGAADAHAVAILGARAVTAKTASIDTHVRPSGDHVFYGHDTDDEPDAVMPLFEQDSDTRRMNVSAMHQNAASELRVTRARQIMADGGEKPDVRRGDAVRINERQSAAEKAAAASKVPAAQILRHFAALPWVQEKLTAWDLQLGPEITGPRRKNFGKLSASFMSPKSRKLAEAADQEMEEEAAAADPNGPLINEIRMLQERARPGLGAYAAIQARGHAARIFRRFKDVPLTRPEGDFPDDVASDPTTPALACPVVIVTSPSTTDTPSPVDDPSIPGQGQPPSVPSKRKRQAENAVNKTSASQSKRVRTTIGITTEKTNGATSSMAETTKKTAKHVSTMTANRKGKQPAPRIPPRLTSQASTSLPPIPKQQPSLKGSSAIQNSAGPLPTIEDQFAEIGRQAGTQQATTMGRGMRRKAPLQDLLQT